MNATKIIVGFSKIDCSSNFDFTGPNYTTKYFGLPHCGDYVKEYWSDEPDKLKLIIEAIANTNMKTSLKTLNLWECGVDSQIGKTFLVEYKMNKVKVVEKSINKFAD